MSNWNEDLNEVASRLESYAEITAKSDVMQSAMKLKAASDEVAQSWSGSPLGYHANVYYKNFSRPVPGDHFSREWGFVDAMHRSSDNWVEFDADLVVQKITELAGNPDLAEVKKLAKEARAEFETSKQDVLSILRTYQDFIPDTYISDIEDKIRDVKLFTHHQIAQRFIPTGQVVSRDSIAIDQGLRVAPHQEVTAKVLQIGGSFDACARLRTLVVAAARHVGRRIAGGSPMQINTGINVFIGHGRSPLWRELKDFVQERLKLQYDEFNRVPVAGVTNVQRLIGMLDSSAIAFLILTAEDERQDGTMAARLNVVHEVGLFQGRLGFSRAIVMLEEGCEEFSNINGLGQIRFPKGRISAAFEEVRAVLEREGIIES